jgi:hypothetical protein
MALDFSGLLLGPAMAAFGVTVLLRRAEEQPLTITGVFDRVHLNLGLDPQDAPVSTHQVQLGLQRGALPAGFTPRQGDRVQVQILNGEAVDVLPAVPGGTLESYSVSDVQPDGAGGILLILGARSEGMPQ